MTTQPDTLARLRADGPDFVSHRTFAALLDIAEAAQALDETWLAGLPQGDYHHELHEKLASLDAADGGEAG